MKSIKKIDKKEQGNYNVYLHRLSLIFISCLVTLIVRFQNQLKHCLLVTIDKKNKKIVIFTCIDIINIYMY